MFEHLSVAGWVNVFLGICLFVSESLPFSESVKSNGIFQGALALLQKLKK